MRVVPIYFTDDTAAARRFLEALGLTADVVSDSGGWVAMTGSGGGVGLHATSETEAPHASGEVDLSFESDEPLEAVARRLVTAGFEADIVDESWGRTLHTIDPDGRRLLVSEPMTDLHGYSRA